MHLLRAAILALILAIPAAANAQTIAVDPQPPVHTPQPWEPPVKKGDGHTYEGGMFGVRASTTHVKGSDADVSGPGMGLQLAGHSETYGTADSFTRRGTTFFILGGGARGFEGGIGADIAFGWRARVATHHGPLARLGMRGWLLGNNELYSSLLELPQLQAGYQWFRYGNVLELAGRVGPVLAGRYNTGNIARRKLGDAFEVGGHAAAHLDPIHLELGYMRVFTDSGPGGAVDMISGVMCGASLALRLCLDGRYYRGNEDFRPGSGIADSVYAGFSIGLGNEWYPYPGEPPRGGFDRTH
ncbi:MAG: hypothetical protein HY898_26630 [Deltaproteobacteria bacterium]|nr:hypothetical protein [Deltaproteobacteria bacterium]